MRPQRNETIRVLLDEAAQAGEDTPLGQVLLRIASTFTQRPEAQPAHAPVPIQAMLPTSAPAGLDRSLPVGDRDEDLSDEAVLSLFEREPGSDG